MLFYSPKLSFEAEICDAFTLTYGNLMLCARSNVVRCYNFTVFSPLLSRVIHLVCIAGCCIHRPNIWAPGQQTFTIIVRKKKNPDLDNWHLLIFILTAVTSHISTYITTTCRPAASTIKPAKLLTPKVICGLLHHRLIACLSTGSASCCMCRLKAPTEENTPVSPQIQGLY